MSDKNYRALRDPDLIEKFLNKLQADAEGTSFAHPKPFAFDIEAGYTGADKENVSKMQFHPDYIVVGVSFTSSTDWAVYVPIAHDDGNNTPDVTRFLRKFWRLLHTGMGVAHNIAYELKGLSRIFRDMLWKDDEVGEEVREWKGLFPFYADTMILVWLSQEYEPAISDITQKDLKKSVLMRFGMEMAHFPDLFPKDETDMGPATKTAQTKLRFNTRRSDSPRVIAYACEDSVGSLMLLEEHYEDVMEGARSFIAKIEHELIPVLVEMEMGPVDPETGKAQGNMFLNWTHIFQKAEEAERFRDLYAEEILEDFTQRLGRPVTLNLNSPPQLVKILYDAKPVGLGLPINDRFRSKKTGEPSTGDDAMKVLANTDPLVKKILTYRQIDKLYNSYLHKYETQLNYAGTGYVFPSHNQAGTVTGRMSVDGVSYQQWPKPQHFELADGTVFDMNFRDLLISPEDYRIIGYDYSQVELRFLAAVAGEDTMLAAFADGTDIHKLTASRMFKMPIEQVDKKSRGKGKTLNFGIVYQQGPDALAESLTANGTPTTKDEAAELLQQYYDGFPKLRAWMDERVSEGHNQGWVETFFKRKFTVWEFQDSRQWIRDKGDRMCINAPIQGGAADYMKIAMVRVYKALKKLGIQDKVRLTMTIHDALEFYVHKSIDTQYVIDVLNPAVSYAVKGLPVQIRADWHEGPTWGALAEIKLDADAKITHYELEDIDEKFDDYDSAMTYWFEKQAEKSAKAGKSVSNLPKPKMTLQRLFDQHKVTPTRQKKIREHQEPGAKSPTPTLQAVIDSIGGDETVARLYAEEQAAEFEPVKIAVDSIEKAMVEETPYQQTADEVKERSKPLSGDAFRAALKADTDAARARKRALDAGPMALVDDEPPWMTDSMREKEAPEAQKTWIITMTAMPTSEQYDEFNAWIEPGSDRIVLRTPEGDINDDKTYSLSLEDQGIISLLLGGADLTFETREVDLDAFAEVDV